VFPVDFFTNNVLEDNAGMLAPRACSTGLAFAPLDDDEDFCIAAFSTSALHRKLTK